MLNEEQGGGWDSHTETHCGHCCYNKNFQILLTSDFHQLHDDVNKNHNYIEYLFILQTAQSDSSFHYLNCFLEQKLKNSDLILAQTGSELLISPKQDFEKIDCYYCLPIVFFHATTFQEIFKEQIMRQKIA